MEFNYDIFLCHTGADKEWVQKLAESVESEDYEDRKLRVFYDDWDVIPGENLVLKLEYALQKSRFVGVILSSKMLASDWPTMEWTIAVSNDPSGRKGIVIPIWLGGCEIPPSLKIRYVLYCRNEIEYKKSYTKLLAILKSQSLPRGKITNKLTSVNNTLTTQFPINYVDDVNEQLASNLFPLKSLPKYVWNGPIGSLTHVDVFDYLRKEVKGVHPTFLVREKRIYAFWDLNDNSCPFKNLLTASNIEKELVEDWLHDSIKKNWLIELLNRAVRNYCWDLNLIYDKYHRRFFFPPYGGENRIIQWHTGKRKSTRSVTTRHVKRKTEQIFWSHQSLRASFMFVGDDIFLQLTPGWIFTIDGYESIPSKDVGRFSTKWTTKEHNPSVFYHIRFWSNLLSKSSNSMTIPLGNSEMIVDITPATIEMNVGIFGDNQPIEKVFEAADEEIVSTELIRESILKGEYEDE